MSFGSLTFPPNKQLINDTWKPAAAGFFVCYIIVKTLKDGTVKTFVRVMESYRPGPGMESTKRTLKSFGYLEDQPDPEAFTREVEAYDADPANREQISIVPPTVKTVFLKK